jgi:hypothetical protein
MPAVPIEAPTSIPTRRYWETTASKVATPGSSARTPSSKASLSSPAQSPTFRGTVGRPDLLRHVGRVGTTSAKDC